MKPLSIIILAAGVGKRMKSDVPKVLHPICGRPLLSYVVETAQALKPRKIVLVVGREDGQIKKFFKKAHFVVQYPPLGTGDAVIQTQPVFQKFDGSILVLCGDVPLLTKATLTALIRFHYKVKAVATVLTAVVPEPSLYGRIIRRGDELLKIVEDQDASPSEKKINEINSGIYVFDKLFLFEALQEIKPSNTQKEYYLTDIIEILHKKGLSVATYKAPDYHEVLGINTRKALVDVQSILQSRIITRLQLEGVTIKNPNTTNIDFDVQVGRDTIIYPGAQILGSTKLGKGCEIGANVKIVNSKISSGSQIGEGSTIENASL